jgi:hypothetical protein
MLWGLNLDLKRRRLHGAAGILPALFFSAASAGKMPAALWRQWTGREAENSQSGRLFVVKGYS